VELDFHTRSEFLPEAVVVVLTMAISSAVSFATATTYASRYASVLFPPTLLLASAGVACLPRQMGAGAFALFVGVSLIGARRNVVHQRTEGRLAAEAINTAALPGDVVLFCPDQLGPAFSRAMRTDLDTMVYPTLAGPDRVDWADYGPRNGSSSPERVASAVLVRAVGHRVFLVWQGGYRTFDDQCETLYRALASARPDPATLVVSQSDLYFEPAAVAAFSPP
jgi:hypothetical protein